MTRPLKIAVPDYVSNSYFPVLAAVELGCFRDEGIAAEVEIIFPPDRAYAALRAGEVDLVAASAHTAVSAFPEWDGVSLICAQAQGMYWFLVMHRELAVARGDVSAVRGRRIGAAPWVELGLRGVLEAAGLDPARDAIAIGPVPKVAQAGSNFGVSASIALERRDVDGFWANGMAAELAVRQGFGDIVLDIRRGDGPPGCRQFTFASVAARRALLADQPELAGAVTRAVRRAHARLTDEPDCAEMVGRKLFPPEAAALIGTLIARDVPWFDTAISRDDFDAMNAFLRRLGRVGTGAAYEEVVASAG
ncbi:ABC transporter substrate-binding protein [Xanthobacter sp. KR7-65]|uniref:ABC transporter substrate-binding protein n=1 Tax=Xanthobacter sp. KR7-65 TaxID=3156612 RepID=UPI0032B329B7